MFNVGRSCCSKSSSSIFFMFVCYAAQVTSESKINSFSGLLFNYFENISLCTYILYLLFIQNINYISSAFYVKDI